MKTMKLGDQIKRVNEKEAIKLNKDGWNYCPKSEWKEKVRGDIKQKVSKNKKRK